MRNLIFLSGPQGGGKTTLIDLLKGPGILVPNLETKTIKLDAEPLQRAPLKIAQRSLENFEYLHIALSSPEKIILGNRCIYDSLSFNRVFFDRGWISEQEFTDLNNLAEKLFPSELNSPFAIVLNPGYEVVHSHLAGRWKSKGKKWREEDEMYLKLACKSYELYKSNPKVLYIDHEISLNSPSDTNKILDWMYSTGRNRIDKQESKFECLSS